MIPDVSIIIVNFNGGELLTECVRSVLTSSVPVEVFISDNRSTDGSIHFLKTAINDERLHIICNGKNLGFAKANNLVLAGTQGNYLLFLNPDCLIHPDTLERLITETGLRPGVGMAGCLICNLDGSEQAGCRRRVPTALCYVPPYMRGIVPRSGRLLWLSKRVDQPSS